MYLSRHAYKNLCSSAVCLQTGMRGMAARNELRLRKRTRAAIVIQVNINFYSTIGELLSECSLCLVFCFVSVFGMMSAGCLLMLINFISFLSHMGVSIFFVLFLRFILFRTSRCFDYFGLIFCISSVHKGFCSLEYFLYKTRV